MNRLSREALLEVPCEVAYAVVVDVLQYPDFLPGCGAVQIIEETKSGLVAQVEVQGAGFKETFITANRHVPNEAVSMSLKQGPFERLEGQWVFTPLGEVGCRVDLTIEYSARGLLTNLLARLAGNMANKMVDAFSQRILQQADKLSPLRD